MRILYFAWVRQKTGKNSENIDVPTGIETVEQLIGWLKTRGEEYEIAFDDLTAIRAAIDQVHCPLDAVIADASEVAFFPPVTGG